MSLCIRVSLQVGAEVRSAPVMAHGSRGVGRAAARLAASLALVAACAGLWSGSAAASGGDVPVPVWTAPQPDPTQPDAGLTPLAHVTTFKVFTSDPSMGTYNHGPIMAIVQGTLFVHWYNGATGEDAPGERVLYAHSTNGVQWSPAAVLFPAMSPVRPWNESGTCVSNLGYFEDGSASRFYAVASVRMCHEQLQGTLMREINRDGATLGDIFWLADEAPSQYASFGYGTLNTVDATTKKDAQAYLAQRLRTTNVPAPPAPIKFSERSWYKRLADEGSAYVLLLRDDGGSTLREWASTCQTALPTPIGLECNWSNPVKTAIPDSRSRTWATTLDSGAAVLFGAQLPKLWDRDPLTVSIAPDGVHFSHQYSVIFGAPPQRFPGHNKGPGFQYPGGLIMSNADEVMVAYSVNKEDIWVSKFPLQDLNDPAS